MRRFRGLSTKMRFMVDKFRSGKREKRARRDIRKPFLTKGVPLRAIKLSERIKSKVKERMEK